MTNRLRLFLISFSCLVLTYVLAGAVLSKGDSATNNNERTYRDLGVYSEVLTRVKHDYVTEPDMRRVTDGAIRGLLESLDSYSTYFTPEQYKDYLAHPDPGPASIGIFLSKRMGFATVVSVLPGSPAEKAGIKPGDLIDQVEGIGVRELSVVQIDRMLAGDAGSKVTLAVIREARGEPQKVEVTRELLQDPPITTEIVDSNTGYIRIPIFNKGKAAEIESKIKELTGEGAAKLVLDLRNCAGGETEEAVKTVDLFVDKGLIAYAQGQRYPRQDLMATPQGPVCKLPLAVLINQSTAGPAEIIAAAMKGDKRAEVVGVRSFGVGVVQKLIQVGDGSAVLLSVAKYYGPDGEAIHDKGVTPEIVQTESSDADSADEDTVPESPEHFGGKDDLQLQKAIDVLKNPTIAKAS
jgi:carboxyl-terminal processing protease